MNAKIEKFRQELNRVFDDDLHTKQWHNYVDYAIIGLIIIKMRKDREEGKAGCSCGCSGCAMKDSCPSQKKK